MALNCGIVGLPNVGKSTIFSALSGTMAEVANYPFCTINENVGIVNVPDERMKEICSLVPSKKRTDATVQFVDIAGIVKGASKGEGLGNKFLANIRETGIIAHVVRCFEDADVVHVNGKVDPKGDIETINTELSLADLETVEKRLEKDTRSARLAKGSEKTLPMLKKFADALENGRPLRLLDLSEDEIALAKEMMLITIKPVIYVCNVSEEEAISGNDYTKEVAKIAEDEKCECVIISGKVEAEIAGLETEEEKKEFLEALGLKESALGTLARAAYTALGLKTFFTCGPDENRAWTFKAGMKAPQCAGIIHTDFEKGFIKAEVYSFEDLIKYKSEAEIRKAGLLRLEGKEYLMQDGDIAFFKFNT